MPDNQLPVTHEELRAALSATELRIIEAMRDTQTEILRGLERFARGNFARMHTLETNTQDANIRLTALEERVLALETKRPGA
jgi:hypothetical protein